MEIMNSRNSPLIIAEIGVGPGAGCLGLTLCPGKKDPARRWDRGLQEDARVIRAWGGCDRRYVD